MKELAVFRYEDKAVRTVELNGEPWFVAKDIAEGLGYRWDGTGTIQHVPEEWRGVGSVPTPSGEQSMAVLSEQGVYFFLARSNKQAALPFQKWIAGEVIPSIRKTGRYEAPQSEDAIILQSMRILQNRVEAQRERITELETKIEADEHKTRLHDTFMESEGLTDINTLAKRLAKYGLIPKTLRIFLKESKVMFKSTDGYWLPCQEHVNNGRFVVKRKLRPNTSKIIFDDVTLATPEGEAFVERLVSKAYPLKAGALV